MKDTKRAGLGVKPALLEEPGSQVGRPCPQGQALFELHTRCQARMRLNNQARFFHTNKEEKKKAGVKR